MDYSRGNVSSTAFPVPRNQDPPKVSVWVPITVILLLAILSTIMVLCSHKFKRLCQKNLRDDRAPSGGGNVVQMTLNATNDRTSTPETPPPAYASLERQFSYVSRISQNSSQIEIPPDYDEMSQVAASSSLERGLRGSNVTSRTRDKLFFRSISALERGSPSKTPSQGIHISSSMVVSNALIYESNEDNQHVEGINCSKQMAAPVPDVVRETSPRGECWQRLHFTPNGLNEPENCLESNEVVFSVSDDSQSFELEESTPNDQAPDLAPGPFTIHSKKV